ncbi:Protein of unknown function DUF789 [Macleaya cordata]|uniref:DUF789 domain-containing protein n=1 Tax=Macleaya cordata TaxID=56857 RepID=A0A200QTQ2_MACCD|nr:Protein of unknown function DUF789 [Macleaya cordata]
MLGTGLQFGRGYGEDRFYNPVKSRRNHYHQNHQPQQQKQQQPQENQEQQLQNDNAVITDNRKSSSISNFDRFLESTTPSVTAQYLSKTSMKGWRTCNVEFQPYFTLGDLWESFNEWSAYGAGVPLILNGSDCVIQYYVPYLSGIQIFGDSTRSPENPRRPGEDSDGDLYKDSSSDGSSDCELERGLRYSREQRNCQHLSSEAALRMNNLSLRDKQEEFSIDEGEPGNSRGCLLFEFFEQDPPYSREPLADKAGLLLSLHNIPISDLAFRFPELKTLRSCDLLSDSWVSVAWYPIYRIPTGPTLKDLDACFLTFHSLSMSMSGAGCGQGPSVTFPNGVDDVPKISIPVFGLASYKCKGSMWTPNGGCEHQLASSLLQAADDWLRLLQVNHPDFQFFASQGAFRRIKHGSSGLPCEEKDKKRQELYKSRAGPEKEKKKMVQHPGTFRGLDELPLFLSLTSVSLEVLT